MLKYLLRKKSSGRKHSNERADTRIVHRSLYHDFFFLRGLWINSLLRDSILSAFNGGLNLFKKFRRPIFRRTFYRRFFRRFFRPPTGLVHASLITSGRPIGWWAEKATTKECRRRYINISYERRTMCLNFINILTCHALSFHYIIIFRSHTGEYPPRNCY